jgi:hypothetical protein
MTYMDVRLLADDLKVTPKDPEPAHPAPAPGETAPEAASEPPAPSALDAAAAPTGGVSVAVDQLARPGAMASGKATFSDGQKADWYIDQYGRLGLVGPTPGYRPPPDDIPVFQTALDRELAKMGL